MNEFFCCCLKNKPPFRRQIRLYKLTIFSLISFDNYKGKYTVYMR